jgi:cytochrome b6
MRFRAALLRDLTPEAVRHRAAAWLHERIDLGPVLRWMSKKTVPVHRQSWIYLLGGAAMFLFALQAASGCLLMLYYQPAESCAHESVRRIMLEVPYGWLIRSLHVWGANLFIAVAGLHFLSVLLTRAYRRPRELTWVSGMAMFVLALAFGFSGYLLPWNELAYYATLVGTKIPAVLPGIGDLVVHLLRGGEQVTGDTITRFFAAHVMILPVCFGLFLLGHLILIQAQGMSLPLGLAGRQVKDQRPFYSEVLLVDACIWLVLLGLIVTLSLFLPAEMGIKADPLKPAPQGIKPEWYFLFMFQTLKCLPEWLGVALLALGAGFLLLLPFVDRNAAREKGDRRVTVLFLAMLAYVLIFEVWAWLAPGTNHRREPLAAETYSPSGGSVSLALFWCAIVFLVVYLRILLQENTRIRKLYKADETSRPERCGRDTV